ncbi:MAG: zinc metallopeptidase [Verrucomicrobiales bacterium]|nr:zinc metallopeptidase [Verrucomicrobiales bacterium]MCP5559036.1 zinc metallopeptidase [Verrucomicrobiaceae bacterium]
MLYFGILIFTLALSGWASWRVRSAYQRYSQVPTLSGMTGAQTAAAILREESIHDVEILEQPGHLTDHYDPMNKRLVLSSENYHGTNAAAVGVAAHECGHAIQHKVAYAPLHWRMAAVGITGIANNVVMWGPLIFMATGLVKPYVGLTIMAIAFGILMLFQLITLPVEFDATRRAKLALSNAGIVRRGPESEAVDKMLSAAGFTYVAAFISTLAYFLHYALPLLMGRSDDD